MAADLGIDQVKIYGFDSEKGTISQVDAVRCELESAPRQFVFSKDGRFFYLMYQLKNAIDNLPAVTGSGRKADEVYVSQDVDRALRRQKKKLPA